MEPLGGNIKRYLSFKSLTAIIAAVVVVVSIAVGTFHYLRKEVIINDDGKQIAVKTMKDTVEEVLNECGIEIGPYDYIDMQLSTKLHRRGKNEINIKRAVPVNFYADGQKTTIMTCYDTLEEVIKNSNIRLGPKDRLEGAALKDKVTSGMNVRIIRVSEKIEKEEIPIPYRVVNRKNDNLDEGKQRVIQEGVEGKREKLFKVTLENGKEIARELIKDTIISNPVDKIIEFGIVLNYKTARGDVIRYKKVLNMTATAYTASFKDTGKHPDHPAFGITRTGIRAKKGIIAVDPKVIPLGTKVYVEVIGKTPDYGFALAADTGGAIKGNKIDLYFDDQDFVDRWGRKKVRVYILHDQ